LSPYKYAVAQKLQQADINALSVIETHNLSNKAASEPCLRLHSLWDHFLPSGMIKSMMIMGTYAR
jgi:hypothetical protein